MLVYGRGGGLPMRIGFHMPFSGSLDRLRQKIHISRGNSFQLYARSLRGVDKEGVPHPLHKINLKKLAELHHFLNEKNIRPIIVHAPYFYNLSQEVNVTKAGAIVDHESLIQEDLAWAETLGAKYYVMQPGYYKKMNRNIAMENIKESLKKVLETSLFSGTILIKNTAGAGTEIASTLSEWNELISFHPRIKGALDFARVYASGYNFTTKVTAQSFYRELEEEVGWEKIEVVYINDTNRGCASNKQPSSPPPLGEGVIGHYGYENILTYDVIKEKIWIVENQPKPSYYDESLQFLHTQFLKEGGEI